MGRYEQGGRAALPIWLSYMRKSLKGQKSPDFAPPPGVVFVEIDRDTGKLAAPEPQILCQKPSKLRRPTEYAIEAGEASLEEFGKEDNF